MVRFRSLRRLLRLRFRSRSGFLPINGEANGLILFRSQGSRRLRSGLFHRVRVLGLDLLLKEARLGPVLLPFQDLRDNVHRFLPARVLGLWVILLVDLDSLVRWGSLRLSGRISLVLLGRLRRVDLCSLLVGLCLSLGVRRGLLRRGMLVVVRRRRISLGLRLARLKHALQKVHGSRRTRPVSRVLLVGKWIGILRLIRY